MGKLCFATALLIAAISFSGCCSPMIGPGCPSTACNECNGGPLPTQYIANGPLDALRNARRNMACGSGCGEVYQGEWISTPPLASDPCACGQFVGGSGARCQPFCWQPGNLLRGLYGQRFCSGSRSSTPCPCGTSACGGGCDAGVVVDEYIDGGILETGVPVSGSTCTSCAAGKRPAQGATQIVRAKPATGQLQRAQQVQSQTQKKVIR